MALGILGVFAANWVARAIGKRNALIVVLLIGLVAFGSSFWLYTPEMPWLSVLCGGLNGFSATGLWVILPSMTVDVIDYDELSSGKRREGAYTATFSWVMKFGMMFSMLIGGPLLELTGFDAKRGGDQTADAILGIRLLFAGIPVTALVIAFIVIYFYPLSTAAGCRPGWGCAWPGWGVSSRRPSCSIMVRVSSWPGSPTPSGFSRSGR
jgi:GPH family glycoside/pentoside/hexuronide:cation symporter